MEKKPGFGCSHGYYGMPDTDCEECQETTRQLNRLAVWVVVAIVAIGWLAFALEYKYGAAQRRCPCCGQVTR